MICWLQKGSITNPAGLCIHKHQRNGEDTEIQKSLTQSHNQAFAEVQQVIDIDTNRGKHMIKLSELSSMYISSLQHTEFANPKVLREKL